MLVFYVFNKNEPLKEWPEVTKTGAFCIYLADENCTPMEKDIDFQYGRLVCYCPKETSRRLFIRHHVDNFGDPVLRTRMLDTGKSTYNLTVELALGRLDFLNEQLAKWGLLPNSMPALWRESIKKATQLVEEAERADLAGEHAVAASLSECSLEISVPAGEELAMLQAEIGFKERIGRGEFEGFLLGCYGFTPDLSSSHDQYFHQAFNYATLPFYLERMEPAPGVVEHESVLALANKYKDYGLKLKGHPLVWAFNDCIPEHLRLLDFDSCMNMFRERIMRDVPPFSDLIEYWDVINEAHDVFWSNSYGFSSQQMIELTNMAANTTRTVAPKSKTVINICLPYGEYVAGHPHRSTPLQYIKGCIDANVDFDIIGIQFYYGGGVVQYPWDMLEVSRILDEYVALGKEVHITELGTPSAMGADPTACIKQGNDVGFWHKEWSEDTQAEWIDMFYRICMSKPAIKAITWWGLEGGFWPHSGLVDKKGNRKKAYNTLVNLRNEIGS